MRIGLFDSGIGGLNVLKEFLKKYPKNEYYYYGDTKNLPYGEKRKETLLTLSTKIIHFFEKKQVDLIIIACGTISSTCYQELKQMTSIPIFDIITPTIEYLQSLDKKNILVFGTKRTIESHIFKKSIPKNIYEVATLEFVPMIESYKIDTTIIKNYLLKFRNIDCLVLGCTHYPLLIPEFKKYLNENTLLVDMGVCLTKKMHIQNGDKQEIHLFFTKIDEVLRENIDRIVKVEYSLEIVL